MDVPEATEVFVRAFSETKSRTYPYEAFCADGLWVMRDAPGRKRDHRKIEVINCEIDPTEAARQIQERQLGWHFLCDIRPMEADFDGIKAAYKELGYRMVGTEGFFVHDLQEIPNLQSDPPVRPLADAGAAGLNHRYRPKSPRSRMYAAWHPKRGFGRVESLTVGESAWVADLFVEREHRGKGYGRALMSQLLLGDREAGVKASVLLASSSGARLYPHLGYHRIGTLQMFCPKERISHGSS